MELLPCSGVFTLQLGLPISPSANIAETVSQMSRIVLVSNRVVDLRKAPQAGGVAVALRRRRALARRALVRLERRDQGRG